MTRQEGTAHRPEHPEVPVNGRGDLFHAACPTRFLLDRVGSKWVVMIVLTLAASSDSVRFGELRRRMEGVSQKMLTQTLRQLESDGLVDRRVEPTSPPAVHYSLTSLGLSLVPTLRSLKQWAEDHVALVEQAHGTVPPMPAVNDHPRHGG